MSLNFANVLKFQTKRRCKFFVFCHFLMYILRCNEITLFVHQFMKVKLEGNLSHKLGL
ncbi:hypothetical protein ACE6H2_028517 [Prunus campanulata]